MKTFQVLFYEKNNRNYLAICKAINNSEIVKFNASWTTNYVIMLKNNKRSAQFLQAEHLLSNIDCNRVIVCK